MLAVCMCFVLLLALLTSPVALQIHKVIRTRFLTPGRDQVFLCTFVVRIECCWIARLDYKWDPDSCQHDLATCCVCPAIPASRLPPSSVLCNRLDDMLDLLFDRDHISLTDLLLMSGSASPTPGFVMLVRYVASLCQLHSIPIAQPRFRLYNNQTLDFSQAQVLAYGHKSLVVRVGQEDAVYKVFSSCSTVECICSQAVPNTLVNPLSGCSAV